METNKIEFSGGATSSKIPRFDLIPLCALEALSAIFEEGMDIHKEKSWNAQCFGYNDKLTKEFVLARLSHNIHHSYKMISCIMNGLFDPTVIENHAGAIMFAGAVTAAWVEKEFNINPEEKVLRESEDNRVPWYQPNKPAAPQSTGPAIGSEEWLNEKFDPKDIHDILGLSAQELVKEPEELYMKKFEEPHPLGATPLDPGLAAVSNSAGTVQELNAFKPPIQSELMDKERSQDITNQFSMMKYPELVQLWRELDIQSAEGQLLLAEFVKRAEHAVTADTLDSGYHGPVGVIIQKDGKFSIHEPSVDAYGIQKPEADIPF